MKVRSDVRVIRQKTVCVEFYLTRAELVALNQALRREILTTSPAIAREVCDHFADALTVLDGKAEQQEP